VLRVFVVVALLWLAAPAFAGRGCSQTALTLEQTERGLALATRALDASGAQVVLLARAGQDLREYGLTYSHFGFAYREAQPHGNRWRVVHKLNQCGSAQSSLYRQGLGEFFLDQPWRYAAAFVVPTAAVQAQLMGLLTQPDRLNAMHHRAYSMVSYAWGLRYQQSNQWALETFAAAVGPAINTRAQAQVWLKNQGYQPSTLKLGTFKRLGARVTSANLSFDDHPPAKRFSGRIETVTVDSVFAWLERANLVGAIQTIASR
jgi:hypothetical protein